MVVWARAFKASKGIYNIVAVIENHNTGAGTALIPYSFKLYDDRNILLVERKGTTQLLPRISIPIFEGSVFTGERIPASTFFEFTDEPLWELMTPVKDILGVSNQVLRDEDRTPRLDARIENSSIRPVVDVEVVAIIYDSDNNALAASATTVDRIEKDSFADVVFTWNEPFLRPVAKIDIVPRVKP